MKHVELCGDKNERKRSPLFTINNETKLITQKKCCKCKNQCAVLLLDVCVVCRFACCYYVFLQEL